jgi:hypothetical protein
MRELGELFRTPRRMVKKVVQRGRSDARGRGVTFLPTYPEPAGTGSFPMAVRRTSEVHDALNKGRHVCERRRDSEAVSCENKAAGLFQHPARRPVEKPAAGQGIP